MMGGRQNETIKMKQRLTLGKSSVEVNNKQVNLTFPDTKP